MAEGGVPENVLQLLVDSDEDDIDIDLGTIFPETGMACPSPTCGTHVYRSYANLFLHWRKLHLSTIKMYKCPMCDKPNVKRCKITQHLRKAHNVPMNQLRTIQAQILRVSKPNGHFRNSAPARMPRRNPNVMTYEDRLRLYGIVDPSFE